MTAIRYTTLVFSGLLAASLAPTPASADPAYSRTFTDCANHADGVTSRMLDCIAGEYARQDKRLNVAYRGALAALPKSRRAAFTAAQRAWIGFRDAECAYAADPEGGSAAHVAGNDCMLRMTAERAIDLEDEQRVARELYGAP